MTPLRRAWLDLLKPLIKRAITTLGLVVHPKTLGVRVVLRDDHGRVLLVRHTYLNGWYLPGGGVDTGETVAEAAARETIEETGVTPVGTPRLHGLYLNRRVSRRDHVALMVYDASAGLPTPRLPATEIAEAAFYPLDALPEETTGATRRRLAEVFDGAPLAADW